MRTVRPERMYRLFEILPAAFAWLTFVLMVVFSRKAPDYVAAFIILFDVYWLLKTVYLSLHLRSTFHAMRVNVTEDWLKRLAERHSGDWPSIYHLVIFPMYRESYEVVRESFASLAAADYPQDRFIVVLGIEERAGDDARQTAERIRAEFGNAFGAFLTAVHPADIPGELPGKGSNETWAARQAVRDVIDARGIPHDQVLVSSFDVDTQVPSGYFARLAAAFLETPNRLRAIYQPVPLFTNNIYQAPALARIVAFSATFWQMMQQARPERLTSFSSQSIPLPALIDFGYWATNIVSEDSRVFWQGYLHYDGDFRCIPLRYPVMMDANAAPTFFETMKNLYRQQRRWAWGAENTPYILRAFVRNPRIPRRDKWYWAFTDLEGRHSWATNAIMIFALGWLPIVLGGDAFSETLLSYNLPEITRTILTAAMVGVATSAALSFALLPPRPDWFRRRHYAYYVLQWLFVPVVLIVFGCIPALDAQTRLALGGRFRLGFWVTPKFRRSKAADAPG